MMHLNRDSTARFQVFRFSAYGFSLLFSSYALASSPVVCNQSQLLGYSPPAGEIKTHRQFTLPFITYPFGTRLPELWGLMLTLKVDEAGHVSCYTAKDEFDRPQPLNERRRAMLAGLADWRYSPFVMAGKPVAAVLVEVINEREAPQKHIPLPDVPLGEVHIALERTACFGSCPSYKLDIHGDGRVVYMGVGYVDVEGQHSYRISEPQVKALIESLRAKDIWSLRTDYRALITDNPTYRLSLVMGTQAHRLEDYVGTSAGMPSTVSDFEDEIDEAAQSKMWVNLSQAAVEILKSERFPFSSESGRALLARAVANEDTRDDQAILSLIKLGAPIDGVSKVGRGFYSSGPLIEEALKNRRLLLIDPLVAQGALYVGGRPDQAKVDGAFRAAIEGGRLAAVRRIWQIAAQTPHPALTFNDVSDDDSHAHKMSPVTLLLSDPPYRTREPGQWEGLEIARWLVAQGCDIKARAADGRTLLHIATEAGDVTFVQYLLDQGIPASTPGKFGLPALGSAESEDVALVLLKAGTDMSKMDDAGGQFRKYAESQHWQQVIAWLDAHRSKVSGPRINHPTAAAGPEFPLSK